MADIHYGGDKADYQDVLARFRAQTAAAGEATAAEAESTKALQGNLGARVTSTSAITSQAQALDALAGALQRETGLLLANTRAWAASAAARGATLGVGGVGATPVVAPPTSAARYGSTQVGYSEELKQFEAQQAKAAESAAARVAAVDAASLAAVQAQAQKVLATRAASGETLAIPQAISQVRSSYARRGAEDVGLGSFGPSQATAQDLKLIDAQEKARASLAGVGTEIEKTNALWRVSVAETAAASQAMVRHGALSAEFIQSLARGEVTLQEFGSALTTTIGKFAGWAVAGGLVYGAFEALKQVARGATETATGVAQLERAQLPGFSRGQAEEGFRRVGARTNVPVGEVAEAQFYAARAGFNRSQGESLEAGETAILAQKLDLVPIQEAARGLGAVRVAFNLNADGIRRVFNELDVGQLKFNARLQQTLPYLGRSASAFAASGGTVEQLTRQIVALTGSVPGGGGGGGSGSAATFFTREPGNLRKLSSEEILRQYGFDPRTPVGTLNEQLQQAVKAGVTPSGARVEAATLGQQRPLNPSQQVLYRLAEAISGGPALAGRYGVQLLSAGARQEDINKELSKAEGAAGEDLKAKLGQFDEQVSAIGHTFERVGSEIGQSGLTAVGEDLLSILKKVGEGAALVVGPMTTLGNIFSSLPTAVQDVVVAAGGVAAVSKFGGFNLLQGSGDQKYVDAARRTTNEGLAASRNSIESGQRQLAGLRVQELSVLAQQSRFAQGEGAPLLAGDLRHDDPRAIELQKEAAAYDQQLLGIRAQSNAINERLITEQQLKITLEQDSAILADKNLQVGQKANEARARGIVVAQGGIGSSLPLIGPKGELIGSAYGADQNLKGVPPVVGASSRDVTAGGAQLAFDDAASSEEAVAARVSGANVAVALDASAARIAQAAEQGAPTLTGALKLAGQQVVDGGQALAEALAQTALKIASIGQAGSFGGIRAAGSEVVGGAALAAGSIGSRIGQNALKGLMYAFIGSAISEIAGEAITGATGNKGLGSTIGGVGSDVALGVGVGALFGAPEIGAGVGLLGGVLDQAGVFGGGSQKEATKDARLKIEKRKLEEGQTKREAEVGGVEFALGREIEASIKDESEGASKAKEKVTAQLQKFAATVKVFGTASPEGKQALDEITSAVARAQQAIFETGPENIAKISELYDKTLETAGKIAEEQLNTTLPSTLAGPQTTAQVQRVLGSFTAVRGQTDEYREAQQSQLQVAEERQTEANEAYKKDQEKKQSELEANGHGIKGKDLNNQLYLYAQNSSAGSNKRQIDSEVAKLRDGVQKNLEAYGNSVVKEADEIVNRISPALKTQFSLALKYGTTTEQNNYAGELAGVTRTAVKAQEDKAKALTERIKKNQDELRKAEELQRNPSLPKISQSLEPGVPAEAFSGLQFADPAQLKKKIETLTLTTEELLKVREAIYGKLPGLKHQLGLLIGLPDAVEKFDTQSQAIDTKLKLNLFAAGGDSRKEAAARSKANKEEKDLLSSALGKYPKNIEPYRKDQLKHEEAEKKSAEAGLQQLQAENKLALSRLPRSDKAGRAAAEARNAEAEADYIKEHIKGEGAFSKYAEAKAKSNEAQEAAGESSADEAREMAELNAQIREAHDVGNPIAQANDAISAADTVIGLARNAKERLQGVLALVNAQNQLQQAIEENITEIGALKESREINPSEKTATGISTLRENLAKAKTPQEKRKYQTDINNSLVKQSQENASEDQAVIDAELHMHEITNQQAIARLQGLLKIKGLTKAAKLQIEQHIYDLQNETGTDFAVGRIAHFPTLYDAATLTKDNPLKRLTQDLPKIAGARPQPITGSLSVENIHHPPQLRQTNYIAVTVNGGNARGVISELERAFRVTTRAQMRTARLTG